MPDNWKEFPWILVILSAIAGMVGGIAVPLSTWIQREFGEPQIKILENPKAFKLPFWDSYKFLLDWRGAWNEVYFGIIFSLLVQVLAGAFYVISF